MIDYIVINASDIIAIIGIITVLYAIRKVEHYNESNINN